MNYDVKDTVFDIPMASFSLQSWTLKPVYELVLLLLPFLTLLNLETFLRAWCYCYHPFALKQTILARHDKFLIVAYSILMQAR